MGAAFSTDRLCFLASVGLWFQEQRYLVPAINPRAARQSLEWRSMPRPAAF
jgi:hypothetical protein